MAKQTQTQVIVVGGKGKMGQEGLRSHRKNILTLV